MNAYKFHTPQCDQWDVPSKTIAESNGVTLELHSLPYNHTLNKLVYFVSGNNGDEFGQFPTETEARDRFDPISMLNLDERRRYDE